MHKMALLPCLLLSACAITHDEFSRKRFSMADVDVCDAKVDAQKATNFAFQNEVNSELERRRLTTPVCEALLKKRSEQRAAAAAALLAVVAVAAIAANSKGGGGSGYAAPAAYDTQWDWDQFYNDSWQLVWACRGVQTGRFAEQSRCAYKVQVDSRWPDKTAPWRK